MAATVAVKKEKIDLSEIYDFLSADLRALNKLWDSGENEMGRRLFVIFAFSALEYIGWLLVNSVNKAIPSHGKGLITEHEIAAAKGKESQKRGACCLRPQICSSVPWNKGLSPIQGSTLGIRAPGAKSQK